MRVESWLCHSTMTSGSSSAGRSVANDLRSFHQHWYTNAAKQVARPARYTSAYTVRLLECEPSSPTKHVANPQQTTSRATGIFLLCLGLGIGGAGLSMTASPDFGLQRRPAPPHGQANPFAFGNGTNDFDTKVATI